MCRMERNPISAPSHLGSASHFEQGLGTGVEEQVKKWSRRSQRQRVQFVRRHGEYDVEVVGVEPDPAAGPGAIAGASCAWHLGQRRDRHEFEEWGASYGQLTHLSLCPPRAAVRQRSTARYAFSC